MNFAKFYNKIKNFFGFFTTFLTATSLRFLFILSYFWFLEWYLRFHLICRGRASQQSEQKALFLDQYFKLLELRLNMDKNWALVFSSDEAFDDFFCSNIVLLWDNAFFISFVFIFLFFDIHFDFYKRYLKYRKA